MNKAMSVLARTKPLEVDIELSDPIPTDEEIEADLKALMKMTELSTKTITSLRRLGVHVKRQGIVETQRGAVYVTQGWLMGAGSELYRLLLAKTKQEDAAKIDTDEVCKLADHLAKLSGKQAELSAAMLSHEPKEPGVHEVTAPPNQAFPAGAVVIGGNAQAHFHQTPPPEKPVAAPPPEA